MLGSLFSLFADDFRQQHVALTLLGWSGNWQKQSSSMYWLMWLQALGAEVIITFEGTSESGAQFMTRQSYLPSEMHWGYVFTEIIFHAREGETEHTVDISRYWATTVLPFYNSGNASKIAYTTVSGCNT